MTKSMTAAVIKQWGGAAIFEIAQLPIPDLEADDVLIKVAYAGVNPVDWKMREGHLASAMPNAKFPLVLGVDASGVVVATGKNVTEFSEGDRVASATNMFSAGKPGSYAEYLVVDKCRVALIPADMTLESASTIPTAGVTAWQALFGAEKSALRKGESKKILINGASGGVGSFAVQLAKWAGAEVATTCSGANLDYVKSLGADFPIDYKTQSISDEISKWAPNGLNLIVDTISADSLADPVALLKRGGRLVNIATLTDDGDVEAQIAEAKERGVEKILAFVDDSSFGAEIREIVNLVEAGELSLPNTEFFELNDVVRAHEKLETGHVKGKLALWVSGDQ
ncbi:Zinc-type alcohol dehydrogenase-like protein [Pseudovibrio sp. Ad46]|uniref:NADP-dependent oxidoreductase n=1 Tax=Pseudovibrio sp. Ad46 TaxID=989432 RepID=UPI0007AE917C|nr:NADP-dependent oxidoreductase [Pseudovibrio sp. Ad46]KZK95097.1 Zinc-type alcohol dehydrogenase-like protein [Pseudovibrio sp. Ad46]